MAHLTILALSSLIGCKADCNEGYALANDGTCYPIDTGDDDDDDDAVATRTTTDVTVVTRTDDPTETVAFTEADAFCEGDELVLRAVVFGPVEVVVFDLAVGSYHEFHELPMSDAGTGPGGESVQELGLVSEGWVLNQSTGLACPGDPSDPSFVMIARAYADEDLVDCVITGDDPVRVVELAESGTALAPSDLEMCF